MDSSGESGTLRLKDNYPAAYSDFRDRHGCNMPCIFKQGASWPVSSDNGTWSMVREVRPVYKPEQVEDWRSIGHEIWMYLDSLRVEWSFIDPLAYANAGVDIPFCPFVVVVGVKPSTLLFETAVTAASTAEKMLHGAGFAGAQVAIVEATRERFVRGPKLLSFDPLLDDIPEMRKRFASTLGIAIAPLKHDHYAGTGSLYYQRGGDVLLLTCAHVARPPPVHPNDGTAITNVSQPREEIISPGSGAFNDALAALKAEIGRQLVSIEAWNAVNVRLGDPKPDEDARITRRRKEHQLLVDGAKDKIGHANDLYNEVQDRIDPSKRSIGFVLHCEPIEASSGARGFTKDWALIELYKDMIDWDTFKGNKVFVSTRVSAADYTDIMWPQPADRATYQYPPDGLLQAYGVVEEDELRNPQHLDVLNQKCLLAVKNGTTTGTTFGRVNGLESFVRHYPPYGINETSMEIAVLNYSKDHPKFSDGGDSGSIVLDRTGKIVGMLTGGGGPTERTDVTYVTPYFETKNQLAAKYADIQLYPVVA